MDKNTLNGLLLMFLVFALFMWLTPKEQPADNAPDPDTAVQTPVATSVDSLTSAEREWLVKNISDNGHVRILADSSRVYTLNQDGMNLSLRGDSVYGTVTVNGRDLDWAAVAAGDITRMSVSEQRKAIEAVRMASVNLGRYGKFARFLAGTPQTVRLENDVLDLQLNSLSGSITRAQLKKYDTEYSADETKKVKNPVVLFEGDKNTFNFQIPLPSPVETSQLYFTPRQLNDSTVLMALDVAPDAFWGIEYTLPKGESYVVRVRVVQKNMAPVVQSNNRNLGFTWQQDLHRQEQGRMFEERNSALYYKYAGGSVENLSESGNDTEERKANGLFLKCDLTFNTTIASLEQYKVGPALSNPKMVKATGKEIKTMRTKCMGPDDMITSLSGGNQQKVIFGKWLEREPQIFMMDEPTRGIDVGAKYEIYELIIKMAKQGKTIIVVSSEMPEILGITNRIGVMSNGYLSGIVNTAETDQEELLRLSAKYL